jgi:hypothetical protein
MRLARPSLLPVCLCLAMPLCLLLLAGLSGCGPASSENSPSSRTDTVASAASSATASPAPLVSENGNGFLPGKGTAPVGDSPKATPTSSTKPVNPMDALEVPAWFAKDLASPNVDTRLRALNTWVLTAPVGSIDPLILAYGTDDDERVQARAMELIKQDLVRAAEAGE